MPIITKLQYLAEEIFICSINYAKQDHSQFTDTWPHQLQQQWRCKSRVSVTIQNDCSDVCNLQASWPASLIRSENAPIIKGFTGASLGGLVLKLK